MKGKKVFTSKEISEIRFLIRQKEHASSSEQKSIKNKIRHIGFYWSDFSFGKSEEYNIVNFNNLIFNGIIRIIDESADPKSSPAQKQKAVGTVARHVKKGLKPWVVDDPKVLILGTMPGDKSLSMQAYYCDTAHNSFWKLMRVLFPGGSSNNKEFVTSHGIALWDCVHSGVRFGSTDVGFDKSTIVPNDLKDFLAQHPTIKTIILNGKGTKRDFFDRYFPKFDACRVITISSSSNTNSKRS